MDNGNGTSGTSGFPALLLATVFIVLCMIALAHMPCVYMRALMVHGVFNHNDGIKMQILDICRDSQGVSAFRLRFI